MIHAPRSTSPVTEGTFALRKKMNRRQCLYKFASMVSCRGLILVFGGSKTMVLKEGSYVMHSAVGSGKNACRRP